MKNNKTLLSALIGVIVAFVIFFMYMETIAQSFIEDALHNAGFEEASVESISIGLSGTQLKNIKIDGSNVGKVEAYASFGDIVKFKLGKIVISNADLHWPLLPSSESASESKSLNLYARQIEFHNVKITLALGAEQVPVLLDGSIIDRGQDYQINANIAAEAPSVAMTGQLTGTLDKATQAMKAHLEIAEGKIAMPDVEVKRLAGWIEADTVSGKSFPDFSAQISAGATKVYGIPLQGLTLSASPAEFLLNGQVANNGGDLVIDVKMDKTDKAFQRIKAHIEAKLKNLDSLGLDKLKGQGSITLDATAEKDATAAWQDLAAWKNMNGSLDLVAKKLTLPGLVTGAEAAVKAKVDYDPALRRLSLKASRASFSDARLSLKEATTDLAVYLSDKPVIEGTLDIGEVAQKSTPAYLVPLKLSMQFQPLSSLQYGTGFSGTATEKNGLLSIKFQGRHDSANNKGNMTIVIPPTTLKQGVYALKDISPASAAHVQEVTGTFGADVALGWQKIQKKWTFTSSGTILLKNVSATAQGNLLTDVNSVMRLSNLIPIAFTEQQVAIGALNAGLPLTNGLVSMSLDEKKNFTLHKAEAELAKGRISSSPVSFNLDNIQAEVILTASKLDLPELFRIAPMEGLDATGIVNGTLPLKIEKTSQRLDNGVLEAESGGEIRYNPKEVPAFLSNDSNKQIADLRVALKAFEYETLRMTFSGEIGKEQKIGLQIKGKNPLFYDGHPVSLNLNVEGPLQNVLKYSPGSKQIPDSIKKQLEEYEKTHASH